ncbi:RNA:RNP complex 1 interacting phosphatase [Trichuris trichiura]|uniref:RNA:RNP complex 1 interacting phosphatase n=2 Tax=Trichuris trichiura TaxID=36087 RepID=A0A077Z8N3_TRITR|nr:RNA:RNP complex 1 interacting phosphatase [Trichuris trichiura]
MVRSKRNQLPVRWECYSAMGEKIPNSPFVPCKTPLRRELCKKLVNPDSRFTVESLVVGITQKDYRIGMVIDLCDTDRYVDPGAFESWGIQHVKIFAPGNRLPHESSVNAFFNAVEAFNRTYRKNADMIICVFSTHGVNRTGYFVCRYLIEKLSWGPKNVLRFFQDSRGYAIERKALVNNLLAINPPQGVNWKKNMQKFSSPTADVRSIMNSSFYSFVPVADEDFVVDKKCSSIADIDKDVYPTDLHTFFLAAEKVSGLQRSSDSPLTEQRLPESLEFESHELQRVGHQDNVGMSFGFPVMMQDYGTYPSVEPKFSVLEDGGEMASSVPRKQKRKRKSKSLEAMYAELKKAKFHNIHELRRKYFKLD